MRRLKKSILLIGLVLIAGIVTISTITTNHKTQPTKRPVKSTVMRTPINWRKSSEKVAYPDVAKYPNLWIHVSLKKQRLYLMTHQHKLYTMYVSTGVPTADRKTPRGIYHVQAERGKYFYSAVVNEGAYYWASWLNHGEYLFHSTPVNTQKQFIKTDAADLGKKPSSHGCIHLSVADSKWIYEHIRYGTKVVID
ncbi:L,D-transpeptidase [Lactiplantibacillus pingfangensis]|uniref:L,D-transpeptidase n=1 Tax=Lactiplantibacillus pingfangensis TaxID=2559915 RepID=UPI0010F932EB